VLVVLVQDADPGPPLQGSPEWKAQQKILWAEAWKEAGRGKSRFKIRDLLTGGRRGQAVPDFLATTDVGRLVPAEEDAGSETPEWERRADVEELGAGGEEPPLFLLTPPSWRPQRRGGVGEGRGRGGSLPLWFPWCASCLLVPPLRGWETRTVA